MKLLYLENSIWELDFIVNDILMNIEKEIEIFNKMDFNLFLNRTDIIENNILVINQVLEFHDIINVVKYIKPIIIFYLSDESGNESHITLLETYTKLLFRQYNHEKYNYSSNNLQIPLGYSKYYLDNKNSLCIEHKPINKRDFNCSFIGTQKSDRIHMTNVFRSNIEKSNIIFVNNNWNIDNLPYTPKECFNIYTKYNFML
jgi:hypothetical protein